MKRFIFYLVLFIAPFFCKAQDSTTKRNWTPKGNVGINVSQLYFENWVQGGQESISWSIFLNLELIKDFENWTLKNKMKLAFGMTKAGESEFRNNENELFIETVASYKLAWAVDPFLSNTIRSVLVDSYNYKTTPESKIATFFDPGYITQSIGFAYDKLKGLNTRLGLAFQETFTNRFRQYSAKPNDSSATFKFETGIETVTAYDTDLDTNLHYAGRFRLFGRFDKLDVWDVRFDNTITAKITKYINVNLTVLVIHEISQSKKTQLKEGLQLGFAYNLFE